MKGFSALGALWLLIPIIVPAAAAAAASIAVEVPAVGAGPGCTVVKPIRAPYKPAGVISLSWQSPLTEKDVRRAVELWGACEGYEAGFPRFTLGGGGASQAVHVRLLAGSGGGPQCGRFHGREIVLFAFAKGQDGRRVFCGDRAENLAHELGHVLGLRDVSETCRDRIMAPRHPLDRRQRRVHPSECQAIGYRWLTPSEAARLPVGVTGAS